MNACSCFVLVVGRTRVKSCRPSVVANVTEFNVSWLISPFDDDGACAAHGTGSGGAYGIRGDGVGVGDIDEEHGDAEKSRTDEPQRCPGKMRRGDIVSARKSMLWPESPLVGWPRAPYDRKDPRRWREFGRKPGVCWKPKHLTSLLLPLHTRRCIRSLETALLRRAGPEEE